MKDTFDESMISKLGSKRIVDGVEIRPQIYYHLSYWYYGQLYGTTMVWDDKSQMWNTTFWKRTQFTACPCTITGRSIEEAIYNFKTIVEEHANER